MNPVPYFEMAVALQDPTERGGLSADLSPVLADGLGRGYQPGLGRRVSEVPGAGQARQRLYSGVQVQDEGYLLLYFFPVLAS